MRVEFGSGCGEPAPRTRNPVIPTSNSTRPPGSCVKRNAAQLDQYEVDTPRLRDLRRAPNTPNIANAATLAIGAGMG